MRQVYTVHTSDGPQLIVSEETARAIEKDVGAGIVWKDGRSSLVWIAPPLPRGREVHRPGRHKINEVM